MKKLRSYSVIIILSLFFLCLFSVLFYRQAIAYNNEYPSDLPAHIRDAFDWSGYSLINYVINILYRIFHSYVSIAVMESLTVVGSWLLTGKLIQCRLEDASYMKSCLLALPLLFVSGIYVPCILPSFYSRQIITQPWHNITYFGMRLFALCVLLLLVKLIDTYLCDFKFWQWCCLAVSLALATACKTSFLLGFAPTLLIFLIADFIKYKFEKKPFIHMILLGTTVFPSLLVMAAQSLTLYGTDIEEGGSGIAVIWGSHLFSNGVLYFFIRLACNLAFPCLVYFMNRKRLDRYDKFTGVMFLVQYVIAAMFTETGARAGDGNFLWGRIIGGYILFTSAMTMFCKDLRKLGKEYTWYKVIGVILLAAHVLSGVVYFIVVLTGHDYLI